MLTVTAATEVTDEIAEAVGRLVPQMSRTASPPTWAALEELIASPAVSLLVARHDPGAVVGMATVAVFPIPTGVRAWIEDVVVDEAARRRGVATALTTAAIEHAAARGARTVELTSRPSRQDANRLYVSLGFVPRDTNVYRITLDPGPGSGS